MANRSFLVVTDHETIYPSSVEADFSPARQTIAQGVYCVPLLWFALFRQNDLRTATIEQDGETVEVTAPLVNTATALTQLNAAIPTLNSMFSSLGSLAEYAHLLRQEIETVARAHITIEFDEIACMSDRESFYAHLSYALGALDGNIPAGVGRKSLLTLCQIDPNLRFPPASYLLSEEQLNDSLVLQHANILGSGWERDTGWELV